MGSGEGADAIWLAARGWNVTGVDVSTVALERAADRAAAAGADIAGRTTWEQADILEWEPPTHRFDLVAAHFMHLPGLPARPCTVASPERSDEAGGFSSSDITLPIWGRPSGGPMFPTCCSHRNRSLP